MINIVLISLTAALGGLLFGFDFAIFAGTIPFLKPAFNLTDAQLGWTSSSIYMGCIAGSLSTGYLADRFGRQLPLVISAAIFAVSAVMMGWSGSYNIFIAWRIIAGIGMGAASMLSPLYIAEISPPSIRGKMVSLNQFTIVTGILLAYLTSYLLSGYPNNWRWMFSSAAVPATIFFLSAIALPESPRWLVVKGGLQKGRKTLYHLMAQDEAEKEIVAIRSSIHAGTNSSFRNLFSKDIARIVMIGMAVAVFQQISGANIVFAYAPLIFEKAGMDVSNQLFQQILIGFVNLLFTVLAMQIIDKTGRRKMMTAGALGMCLLLLLISSAFYFNWLDGPWLSLFTLLFIAVYATTLAPVTWVLIAEIFPNRVRGMAMSAATTMLWLACFGVAYIFPILIGHFKQNVYISFLIFAGICFIYFIFLLQNVPETKNKSLEQIEKEFLNR